MEEKAIHSLLICIKVLYSDFMIIYIIFFIAFIINVTVSLC